MEIKTNPVTEEVTKKTTEEVVEQKQKVYTQTEVDNIMNKVRETEEKNREKIIAQLRLFEDRIKKDQFEASLKNAGVKESHLGDISKLVNKEKLDESLNNLKQKFPNAFRTHSSGGIIPSNEQAKSSQKDFNFSQTKDGKIIYK